MEQGIEGGRGGVPQVQLAAEEFDILGLDLGFLELQVKIGGLAADSAGASQADDLDGGTEMGLEP